MDNTEKETTVLHELRSEKKKEITDNIIAILAENGLSGISACIALNEVSQKIMQNLLFSMNSQEKTDVPLRCSLSHIDNIADCLKDISRAVWWLGGVKDFN